MNVTDGLNRRPPGGAYFDHNGAEARDRTVRAELMNEESRRSERGMVPGMTAGPPDWLHRRTGSAITAIAAMEEQASLAGALFGPAVATALLSDPRPDGRLRPEIIREALVALDGDYRHASQEAEDELRERYRVTDELYAAQDAYDVSHRMLGEASDRLRAATVELRLVGELTLAIRELVTSDRYGGTSGQATAKIREARRRAEKYVNTRLDKEEPANG